MLRCGLLGEKLGHSYSPRIHALLGDYEYRLYERAPEKVEAFVRGGEVDAFNVTIPYKKTVAALVDELSDTAARIGSVNTVVRRKDGTLFGDNTDVAGFSYLVKQSGIKVAGKKVLVLGSGGASAAVCASLAALGAGEIVVISRSGENNYENLEKHADAAVLVNTTPLGMYPKNGASPVDLTRLPSLSGVLDVVYNPARTALLLQAESLGLPCAGGLSMLVAQAAGSSALFTGRAVPPERVEAALRRVRAEQENIVLIGMPGCGKTTIARLLAEKTGRPLFDSDALIVERAGESIPEIFERGGEERFRRLETEVLEDLGKRSGAILATGGGCVTRQENYPLLHQNGRIFFLERRLSALPKRGRPISLRNDLGTLYAARLPLYRRFADETASNDVSPLACAETILKRCGLWEEKP